MSKEIFTAADYHRATSYRRHALTPHALDWAHQPMATKRYPQADRVPMDRSRPLPEIEYPRIAGRTSTADSGRPAPLDVRKLSTVFRLTQDVTARAMHGGQPFYYRSVASAGALYPFELYLAAYGIDGLAPGAYHYNLLDFSLTALRHGPAPGIPPVARNLAATFYITGIFFRSAWKYRSRAYRYVLLDAGHLLENLRLALAALGMVHSIHLDFDDRRAATLLGLDPQREACLACVHLYGDSTGEEENSAVNALDSLPGAILQASMVSDREIAYPEILGIHQAGNTTENRSVDAPAAPHVPQHPAGRVDRSGSAGPSGPGGLRPCTPAAPVASKLRARDRVPGRLDDVHGPDDSPYGNGIGYAPGVPIRPDRRVFGRSRDAGNGPRFLSAGPGRQAMGMRVPR